VAEVAEVAEVLERAVSVRHSVEVAVEVAVELLTSQLSITSQLRQTLASLWPLVLAVLSVLASLYQMEAMVEIRSLQRLLRFSSTVQLAELLRPVQSEPLLVQAEEVVLHPPILQQMEQGPRPAAMAGMVDQAMPMAPLAAHPRRARLPEVLLLRPAILLVQAEHLMETITLAVAVAESVEWTLLPARLQPTVVMAEMGLTALAHQELLEQTGLPIQEVAVAVAVAVAQEVQEVQAPTLVLAPWDSF
jgi:hypothetical protein